VRTLPLDSPSDTILCAAADLLSRHGMYAGHDFWLDAADQPWNPALAPDPLAAIAIVLGGRTHRDVLHLIGDCDHLHPAVRAVFDHLGFVGRLDDQVSDFFAWCDRQRCEHVIDTFQACTQTLRPAGVPA
jgi:hypothetical protein